MYIVIFSANKKARNVGHIIFLDYPASARLKQTLPVKAEPGRGEGRGTRIRTLINGFGDHYSAIELCPYLLFLR